MASIQIFLIVSTCFLYLVAAGLFSKAVWYFEAHKVSRVVTTVTYSWANSKLSGTERLEETLRRLESLQAHMISDRAYGTSM